MIKITDKYYIDVQDQYIVQEKTIAQSGKSKGSVRFKNFTYHRTMAEALTNIIQRMDKDALNGDKVISLKEAIQTIKAIQKEFTEMVQDLEKVKE